MQRIVGAGMIDDGNGLAGRMLRMIEARLCMIEGRMLRMNEWMNENKGVRRRLSLPAVE
jgi:hypothetical protein